ncbi:hypothetical protein RAS1_06360 [Phycisphaerae bacterium RAS1]|nr:hypothetical protein RAS1_06360 [Phycisphaerae bacterium RAS1]
MYECDQTPANAGWDVLQVWCAPLEWVVQGWLYQHVELCPGYDEPNGQTASYRRSADDLAGAVDSYIEWRLQTDAPRTEIPWGGGAALAVADDVSWYSFNVASDQAKLFRSSDLPIVFVAITHDLPHTYRLEVRGTSMYTWYVDGEIADSGVPVGPFPGANPRITWRARSAYEPNTTRWDYIRYGTIPADASGDYDSDGDVDADDFYFFEECALGDGVPSGPGCRFADFDADGDTDCDDWAEFAARWSGPPETLPLLSLCATQLGDLNCDGNVNILDINAFVLVLSDPAAYTTAYPGCNPANGDINGDDAINVLDINPFVALLSL